MAPVAQKEWQPIGATIPAPGAHHRPRVLLPGFRGYTALHTKRIGNHTAVGADGSMFVASVEQALAPTLQPGDTLIIHNLARHKVAGIREAIEQTGASF